MFLHLKTILAFLLIIVSGKEGCQESKTPQTQIPPKTNEIEGEVAEEETFSVGAAQLDQYLPLLANKSVGLVVNQTSTIGNTHLVDSLLNLGVAVKTIFAPEHGFRGTADAGESVADGKDRKTGVPLISLYGKKKKPAAKDLQALDIIIFDIQDVGARFYTYISSMHYIMEACAENNKAFLVLDRPNPNGHYVDGPVLDPDFQSFIGMHPIPVVHGMTIAEYARMINGEGWLAGGATCNLSYIPCTGYTHKMPYHLPIKPSPNLPNSRAIYLYPSLCFFEGTTASVGRGTNQQFQIFGHPDYPAGNYQFTPRPMPGAKHPKLEGEVCKGYSLTEMNPRLLFNSKQLNLRYLLDFYQAFPNKESFFLKNLFFDKLAGTDQLRKQIIAGKSVEEVRSSWSDELMAFKQMRKKYLLYEDFE